MILTLISVGKFLEAWAKGRAGSEIEALLDLAAKQATVKRDGEWVTVDATEVQVGEIFVVKPGERFPADGEVWSGSGTVDESMLTGESVPVHREPGDEVTGGTINVDGRLEVEARRVGAETTLAQITRVVEEAQESKADAQRLADDVSSIFVPLIMVVATITFAFWYFKVGVLSAAVAPAVAVLIVACPCALGPSASANERGKGLSQRPCEAVSKPLPSRPSGKDPPMPRQHISSGSPFEAQIGYSRAVVEGGWVFVAGTTGYDYTTMSMPGSVVDQCRNALMTIDKALREAGASLDDVTRVRYILPDPADFEPCWPVLSEAFAIARPAATMIVAGLMTPEMKIEIEVTARQPARERLR